MPQSDQVSDNPFALCSRFELLHLWWSRDWAGTWHVSSSPPPAAAALAAVIAAINMSHAQRCARRAPPVLSIAITAMLNRYSFAIPRRRAAFYNNVELRTSLFSDIIIISGASFPKVRWNSKEYEMQCLRPWGELITGWSGVSVAKWEKASVVVVSARKPPVMAGPGTLPRWRHSG